MKAGFFYISLAVAMFACKSANNLEKKEAELANYKKQYEELETKIASLEKEISEAGGKKNVVTKPVYVSIDTLEPGVFRHYVEVQGKVDTDKNITLVSKASGTIEKIYVQKGQYVKAGTLLASIDDAIVQKGIEEVNTQLAFATNVYDKQKRLWDQNIGSEIQFLSAKNNKESLEKRKESLIEQHQLTKIKSPIDGVVDEIFPNQGEVTAPGAPAFRVINSSAFKILAEIPESYVSKIRKGDEAILTFPDVEETAKTKVTVVSDVVNAINRSFQVELDAKGVKNLKANLIANVKIKDYEKADVMIIPINVIQHSDQGDYVFIADKGIAVKKMISTGKTYHSSAEVLSGLSKGDKLITVGYQDLVDGQPVTF